MRFIVLNCLLVKTILSKAKKLSELRTEFSRADQTDSDPLLGQFLNFLARDIEKNPKYVQAISADLVSRAQLLISEVEVDLDAPVSDENE
jgi:antitoxin PrlF